MSKGSVKCLSSFIPKKGVLKSKALSATAGVLHESDDASASSLKSLIGHVQFPGFYSSAPEKVSLNSQRNVSAFLRKDAARPLVGGVASCLGLGVKKDLKENLFQEGKEEASILLGNDGLKTVQAKELEPVRIIIPWAATSNSLVAESRKEISRERKLKWVYKNTKSRRFKLLARKCSQRFGSDSTLKVFSRLGRQATLSEFHELIGYLIVEARETDDEETLVDKIHQVSELFIYMREKGFSLDGAAYGPLLKFLIETNLVEEFHFFCDLIKDGNETCLASLGYYEMLLYIQLNDEEKILQLLDSIIANKADGLSKIGEYYLAALADRDQKEELVRLLEVIDITNIQSVNLANIFKSLGRLSLQYLAEKLVTACKTSDYEIDNLSKFICCYVISLPYLASKELVSKFRDIHVKHVVLPSSTAYEQLVSYFCETFKVYTALDVIKESLEEGISLSLEIIHSLLYACDESCEYHLVDQIYSMISEHDLKPTSETFKRMIHLRVKMKDFEGAYAMLRDIEKTDTSVTSSMYNAIMAGFLREKNIGGAMMVLRQMKNENVKPDSMTYSMLIGNAVSDTSMLKFYNEMKEEQIHMTKSVYMAVINSYASRGQFDEAKQVALDKGIPENQLYEVKSSLVSALATHGRITDALEIYDETKKARCSLDAKAVLSIIEHVEYEGEFNRLNELLEELNGSEYWCDGCIRVILYCMKYDDMSHAIQLTKELKDEGYDELAIIALCDRIFCQIAENEPVKIEMGINFLRAIKEELGMQPSRKGLDFLLAACATAKDLTRSLLVWNEFMANDYPFNTLNYLGMYKALLACGDRKRAKNILKQMPKDDYHVQYLVNVFQKTYCPTPSGKMITKETKCSEPS